MATFYLILVIILFFLAISDLIVGVSNDAVNFLNSAVGAKAASFKWIMVVAALGVLAGATFSSGMMEVARKGIFHPEYFYFSEIIILFLAVMITDVILLDTFNTYGLPTSTTVSIVFELLGAAVAISAIKIFTDPDALKLYEYINSAKALAIISGILLSVGVAFTAGVIVQYLSRLLFSFDYEKKLKYFGSMYGGIAIAAITYFILIKGSKGASFMTSELKASIVDNTWLILAISFIGSAIILQILYAIMKLDILRMVVMIGTFALAMAFAGNDLVNFIGVPLAGYNSYELFMASGGTDPTGFLMNGLAGKVPTPTLLLLLAGVIMVITLLTSKKAYSVVKTSLDLGRQDEGTERFSSFVLSRRIVRNFATMAMFVNDKMPPKWKRNIESKFDQRPFTRKQMTFAKEDAPSFDMLRASVTLVVASILITIGTNLKLPLSTTYVTFMVFMGTSLADGAWGRESAVYRVSGVLSVVGGWFFTAFSAFTVAFILALLFYFGGIYAIVGMILIAGFVIYRTHKLHNKRTQSLEEIEKSMEEGVLTKDNIVSLSAHHIDENFKLFNEATEKAILGLESENLTSLNANYRWFQKTQDRLRKLKSRTGRILDRLPDEELEAGHLYILVVDYLREMARDVNLISKSSLSHVDNNHKPLLPEQIKELKHIHEVLKERYVSIIQVYQKLDHGIFDGLVDSFPGFVKLIRGYRKIQIKRIKAREVGTRNSMLYLNLLGEFRNLLMFSNRVVKVLDDMIISPLDEAKEDFEETVESSDVQDAPVESEGSDENKESFESDTDEPTETDNTDIDPDQN